jgi:hypothetical protein
MANTDNNQTLTQLAENKSTKENLSTGAVTKLTKTSDSIAKRVIEKKSPLMRCFDLVEEANYSYVLGYN